MCDDMKQDHSLNALIDIVADEGNPLSNTMRRMALHRLQELSRVHDMMQLITGRDDWRRMTEQECLAIRAAVGKTESRS